MVTTVKKTAHFPTFEDGDEKTQKLPPLKQLVKRLTEIYGPSGHEHHVRELIRDEIRNLVDESIDESGHQSPSNATAVKCHDPVSGHSPGFPMLERRLVACHSPSINQSLECLRAVHRMRP